MAKSTTPSSTVVCRDNLTSSWTFAWSPPVELPPSGGGWKTLFPPKVAERTTSQTLPETPGGQVQRNRLGEGSEHVPPLRQGSEEHSAMSVAHVSPVER